MARVGREGHGQDARGTDAARMAAPQEARATMAKPVPSEVEGMAVPQNRTRGTGPRNEEAPPKGGGANQRSWVNLALDGG